MAASSETSEFGSEAARKTGLHRAMEGRRRKETRKTGNMSTVPGKREIRAFFARLGGAARRMLFQALNPRSDIVSKVFFLATASMNTSFGVDLFTSSKKRAHSSGKVSCILSHSAS